MKRLLLSLLLLIGLSSEAQQVITATLTVTNTAGTVNGQTISVNGHVRTWTNNVSNALTQIPLGTNISSTASNLFASYAMAPETSPLIQVSRQSTNVVFFRSFPGLALTITRSAGWASLSFSTNTITNAVPIRAPAAAAGGYEWTNAVNALVDYLNSTAMGTNIFKTNALVLANYNFDRAALTNFALMLSTNGTNFALMLSTNLTNYVNFVSNHFGIMLIGLDTAAFQPVEAFQPACAALTNLCALGTIQGLSYIEAGTGNILLANTNGIERLRADEAGNFYLKFHDGNTWGLADTSFNVYLEDHNGVNRYEQVNSGATVLRTGGNHDTVKLHYGGDQSEAVDTYAPITAGMHTWPHTLIGTTTNFLTDANSSGTADTTVDSFNVPANTMLTDGDTVLRHIGVKFASGSGTKRVQVYFAGTSIFDSTALTTSTQSYLSIRCEVTRRDSSTVSYNSMASGTGFTPTGFANVGTIGGLDFTAANNFYIVLTSSTGTTLTVQSDSAKFAPSPAWGGKD